LLDTIRANLKPRTAAALPTNWYEISSAARRWPRRVEWPYIYDIYRSMPG